MREAVEKAEAGQGVLAAPAELRAPFGAFLCLIGASYFQRYKARLVEETAPRSFTSTTDGANQLNMSALERWLDALRESTWTACAGEEGNIPSIGALFFHFMRGMLVLRIWDAATTGWTATPDLESFGYKRGTLGELELRYNFDGQIRRIEEQVGLVMKGCGCKTGCESGRCKCRKAGQMCSVSCRCVACKNVASGLGNTARTAEANVERVGSNRHPQAAQGGRESIMVEEKDEEDADAEWQYDGNSEDEAGEKVEAGGEEESAQASEALDELDFEMEDVDEVDDIV
jgi:hypothetical protein